MYLSGLKIFLIESCLLVLFSGRVASLMAQDETQSDWSEYIQGMHSLSSERSDFYQELMEEYAPRFYHDSEIIKLKNGEDLLSPRDVLINPFFDGDDDWRNNFEQLSVLENNIGEDSSLNDEIKSRVGGSVVETLTHFYITYMTYHAFDGKKVGGHTQDSEVVWTVVRKVPGEDFGELEFVVTNAHGQPKFYSPDPSLQDQIRKNWLELVDKKDRVLSDLVYVQDRFAREHHEGKSVFIRSGDGKTLGLEAFICRTGHAIYKLNPERWEDGFGNGYIYGCVPEGEETMIQVQPVPSEAKRFVGYSIFNLDKLMLDLYPDEENEEEQSDLFEKRQKMFTGNLHSFLYQRDSIKYEVRTELPLAIVPGRVGERAAANLPMAWTMKTQYPLSMPHLLHWFLENASSDGHVGSDDSDISDIYIFNVYIRSLE